MAIVFEKPSLWRRLWPLLRGFDLWLLLAVLILAGLGLTAMYSSGFDHGTRFADHGRNMLIALGILFVVAQVPPQRLMSLAVPLYVLGVVLLLGVEFFGITRKGATRWLNVGVVIQPSELLKIATPLMMAWWFHRREGQTRPIDFIGAFALLAVPVGLIMRQPDLGTALLVMAAGLAVIFFAGLSWKLVLPPVVSRPWRSFTRPRSASSARVSLSTALMNAVAILSASAVTATGWRPATRASMRQRLSSAPDLPASTSVRNTSRRVMFSRKRASRVPDSS